MGMNSGRPVPIFDIPAMFSQEFEIDVTEINIKYGFRSTCIWPMDADIFQEIDFTSSLKTGRPDPEIDPDEMHPSVTADQPNPENTLEEIQDAEKERDNDCDHSETNPSDTSLRSDFDSTFQLLLPFWKAPPRTQKKKRMNGKTNFNIDVRSGV